MSNKLSLQDLFKEIQKKEPNHPFFQQAVKEVFFTLQSFLDKNPKYTEQKLIHRLVEPERVIIFRVTWLDDKGEYQVNRGFRVQMNSAIGPYKGGIRFHPSVNLDICKFLAFEQTFKNSLTTLPMGGAKGGSNFDPKGKSDNEIMKFCQAFINELYRHVGQFTDVPAGDIGVGSREIGYMFGQYKKITNTFSPVLTGKDLAYGGSLIRPESTGYGTIYFVINMLKTKNDNLEGKKVLISGSGNVAQFATKKSLEKGAKVLTLSDSNGFVYFPDGITPSQLEKVMEIKNIRRERLSVYAKENNVEYFENKKVWDIPCDVALPCATQNELDEKDAEILLKNGCICVAEGANMPSTIEAVDKFIKAKILYAPGKASNAGGVAISGLEISQNNLRLSWDEAKVDKRLQDIMLSIHEACIKHGKTDGFVNYLIGANIAGFKKVADAMLAQGAV